MNTTVSEIARHLSGELKGNGGSPVRGAAGLAEATDVEVTFLKDAANPVTLKLFETTRAAAVIVPKGFPGAGKTVIECANPQAAFAQVLTMIAKEAEVRPEGIHASAVIHPTAKIGAGARIGAHCIVEAGAVIGENVCLMGQNYVGARTKVGDNTFLYPQVVLREDVSIGKRCLIHAGAVIGSDGYGFFFANGQHNKIPQVGTVIVHDDVEIGSCTTIDRATTGATVIGRGVKIDNLVQVAHNVQVGPLSLLVAQVGIGGSTKIGTGVILGGQVGVADHVTIGDGVKAGAQTGINRSIEPGAEIFGSPAEPVPDRLRQISLLRKLPELFKDVRKLKERMETNG